ncbi:MAG TPA: Mov34/MPN/PAD-1 family protein [Longimicrobiales bacterium]
MTRTLAVLALAGCALLSPAPDPSDPPLRFAPGMLAYFEWLQREAQTETAVCLYGRRIRGRWYVESLRPPVITRRTVASVSYQRCDGNGYIGVVHNHPAPGMCYFSGVDRRTFEADPSAIVDVVTCKDGMLIAAKGRRGLWLVEWDGP